jgi:hypothetical protein
MSQILELKEKDIAQAEEYLTALGWEFYSISQPEWPKKTGTLLFSWKPSQYDNSKADSWIKYKWFYPNDDYNRKPLKRIILEIHSKKKYLEYLNAIKGYGCRLDMAFVREGILIKKYVGKTTAFQFETETTEGGFPMWTLKVSHFADNFFIR